MTLNQVSKSFNDNKRLTHVTRNVILIKEISFNGTLQCKFIAWIANKNEEADLGFGFISLQSD